jgi:hypothetical protein
MTDLPDAHMNGSERRRLALVLALLGAVALASQPACYQRELTREDAAAATFRVDVDVVTDPGVLSGSGETESHHRWSGTAWVAEFDYATSRARLVTAGHVCETRAETEEEGWFGPVGKVKVRRVDYALVAADGTKISGLTVAYDDDDVDLCVLSYQGWLARPLPIAAADPQPRERGWYVGAPRRVWGGGAAPSYDLEYAGRGSPFREMDPSDKVYAQDELVLTGPIAGGASGSAAVVGGVVVGVINLAPPRWPNFGAAVSWRELRWALDRASHRP